MNPNLVSFPGLGLSFELKSVAINLFGWGIHWYGIIIAAGLLLAAVYCYRRAPSFGIEPDTFLDMLNFAVPLSIVGARVYYVLFYLDLYRTPEGGLDWGAMVRFWDGGLAIYGSIIAAVLTLGIFCKVRGVKFLPFADLGVYGLLIGQAIGRWGNFVNIEAYGSETTLPWRMRIFDWSALVSSTYQPGHIDVHPTFLYESLWNVLGFVLLVVIAKNWRRFDGQMFLTYLAWYGAGRAVIEGLRTDSLYFFGLELMGQPIRTSQMVGALSAAVAVAALVYLFRRGEYRLTEPLKKEREIEVPAMEEEEEAARHDDDTGR